MRHFPYYKRFYLAEIKLSLLSYQLSRNRIWFYVYRKQLSPRVPSGFPMFWTELWIIQELSRLAFEVSTFQVSDKITTYFRITFSKCWFSLFIFRETERDYLFEKFDLTTVLFVSSIRSKKFCTRKGVICDRDSPDYETFRSNNGETIRPATPAQLFFGLLWVLWNL